MGIRVKKAVGYGLTDLKHNAKGQPEDERLHPEGYLCCRDDERREEEWHAEGYFKFLVTTFGKKLYSSECPSQDAVFFELGGFKRMKKDKHDWVPWDSVIHDEEFGLPDTFVVIPFCMAVRGEGQVWKRNDDLIDYTEESQVYDQGPRVLEIPNGIYPWTRTSDKKKAPVPEEVVSICEYLRIFKDPQEARKLRPLLYVYWA